MNPILFIDAIVKESESIQSIRLISLVVIILGSKKYDCGVRHINKNQLFIIKLIIYIIIQDQYKYMLLIDTRYGKLICLSQ